MAKQRGILFHVARARRVHGRQRHQLLAQQFRVPRGDSPEREKPEEWRQPLPPVTPPTGWASESATIQSCWRWEARSARQSRVAPLFVRRCHATARAVEFSDRVVECRDASGIVFVFFFFFFFKAQPAPRSVKSNLGRSRQNAEPALRFRCAESPSTSRSMKTSADHSEVR